MRSILLVSTIACSFLFALSAAGDCFFCQVSHKRLASSIVEVFHGTREVNCAMKCKLNTQCKAFSWNLGNEDCSLYDNVSPVVTDPDYVSYSPALCTGYCRLTAVATEYTGTHSTTPSGRTCQRWDSQVPHEHVNTPSNRPFPDADPKNYCRNPDESTWGLWCYTVDPDVRYEACKVRLCCQ